MKDEEVVYSFYSTIVRLGLGGNTLRAHLQEIYREFDNIRLNGVWLGKKR